MTTRRGGQPGEQGVQMMLSGSAVRDTAARIESGLLDRWRGWFVDAALPFWRGVGYDQRLSLFHEQLHLDGTPDATAPRRVRCQARQIYVYCHATELGLDPGGAATAHAALLNLRRLAAEADPVRGWAHLLDREGAVANPLRDLYDHAFVLLMLAHARRAGVGGFAARWAEEAVDAIDLLFPAAHGGFAEDDQGKLPRRQNPHMHLLEAFLALAECTGEARYLARAAELFGLFRTRFFDDERGVLREYFSASWECLPGNASDHIEPGHLMEWVWLLRRYHRLTDRPVEDLCAALFARGEALGLAPEAGGFLIDATDLSGSPLLNRRRLWTQTEYLKALVVEARAHGDIDLWRRAQVLSDRLFETYLAPSADAPFPLGCWHDSYTVDGKLNATFIPASSLYHLFGVVATLGAGE